MKAPGAIILIGLAVVIIVIGATDRAKDVWAAITGNIGGTPNNGTDNVANVPGNSNPTDTPKDQDTCDGLVFVNSEDTQKYCCPVQVVGGINDDGTCPKQYTKGQSSDGGGFIDSCAKLNKCTSLVSGQAGYGSMHVVTLPTGFTGFRYNPHA